MLPTKSNHTKDGCVATSSNCVIWQGPDLHCINVCNGDTVSDVIAKLALELCDLIEQTSIDGFNITCLNALPTPLDFHDLVQLLITRICALEEEAGGGGGGENPPIRIDGCPNCMVALPACLQYRNPATQSLVTQLDLSDYAALVATELCETIAKVTELQETVLQNSTDITNLDTRVTNLEASSSATPTLPNVDIKCINNLLSTPLTTAVVAIADELCDLESSIGTITEILNTALTQCPGLDSSPALSQPGVMSSLTGWTSSANSLTETITNLWLTVCDMRGAIMTIQTNCCGTLCSSINVDFSVTVDSQINLLLTGIIPTSFTECNPLGTLFTIIGEGFSGSIGRFNVPNLIGNPFGINIPAGLNVNADFTVSANLCLQDVSGSQCESTLTYVYKSTIACPVLTLTPGDTTIGYSFPNIVGNPIYYNIELLNSSGTSVIQTQLRANPTIGPVTGSFTGLLLATTYQVRIKYSSDNMTYLRCPLNSTSTTTPSCTQIDGPSVATIEITPT
jgi:hypothetical protein